MTQSPLGWPASDAPPLDDAASDDAGVQLSPLGWMVPRETPKE